jgi:TolA protein
MYPEPEKVKLFLKFAAFTGILLVVGCATDHHITRAESMKVTVRGNDLNHYATQIHDAIKDKMPITKFDGMSCTLRMRLARDGMVLKVSSEGGDAALCDAALKAVQVANIPPAPSDEVYQVFKNTPLDFRY